MRSGPTPGRRSRGAPGGRPTRSLAWLTRNPLLLPLLGFLIASGGTALLASGFYLWSVGALAAGASLAGLLGIGLALIAASALLLGGPSLFSPSSHELPAARLAQPYLRSARAASEEGQDGVALTLCQRALEVDPQNVAALLEMADIYKRGADEVRALKLYNQAIDRLGPSGRSDPLYAAARTGIAEIVARHPPAPTDPAGEVDIR